LYVVAAVRPLRLTLWDVALDEVETVPYEVVRPYEIEDDATSPVVHVTVAVVSPGVPDEMLDMPGTVVSMTRASLAARFVAGTKLDMALPAKSAIVPEIDETVRSDDVSPDWTV
jgi:hypothetical protein